MSLLRILVFVETWNLNWEFVVLEILDFELRMCWIGNLDFIFWLHFAAANLKKKLHIPARFPLQPHWYVQFLYIMEHFVPFFNAVSEEPRWYVILSIAVVQLRLYLQYFLSRLNRTRLYNRACKPYTTAINCLFSTSDCWSLQIC